MLDRMVPKRAFKSARQGFSLLLCFLSFAHGTALHRLLPHIAEDLIPLVTRQQPPTIPITGVSSTFGIQPRLEIRQLQQNADQWNLYLLGLQRMQAVNQSDPLSWYQIAGIHGMPYVPWDNVQAAPGQSFNGYCTHSSTLFLTWHRPFLALFEQVLYQRVTEAANEFPAGPLRQRYAQAALSFRIPYWDWAMPPPDGGPTLPDCVTWPTINVTVPSADNTTTTIQQISNPLYSYVFHPLVPSDFYYSPDYTQFTLYPETLRAPTSSDANASSNNNYTAYVVNKDRGNLQDRVYNLMTSSKNYTLFCTEMWYNENSSSSYDSLEAIHDVIHNDVGNSGHMTYLQYSAFDPIFWLHHTMVDRLFAMWQVINPNSFIEPAAQLEGTFTYAAKTVEDGNSPLTPLHTDTSGDFWTSFNARDINTFGYSYPELWNNATNSSLSVSDVQASINTLYGNSATVPSLSSRSPGEVNSKKKVVGRTPVTSAPLVNNATTPNGARREYITTIRADRNGLGQSFSVFVFLGPYDENQSRNWIYEPNLVGTQGFFANLGAPNSTNPLMSSGTVPLTTSLTEKVECGELEGLGVNEVSTYLKQNLRWQVRKADGSVVPADQAPGLKVGVVSANVEPATAPDKFPVWGSFVSHTHSTEGLAGGLCPGEAP